MSYKIHQTAYADLVELCAYFCIAHIDFFLIFFINIQQGIRKSTRETLSNRKFRILKEIRKNGDKIPADAFSFTDFKLNPFIGKIPDKDIYSDTLIYEIADREEYQFRKLSTVVTLNNKFYKLEIVAAQVEKDELIESLTKTLSLAFVLMVITFFFTSRFFSKKLWKPFYITLDILNNFEIDRAKDLNFNSTQIVEFSILNRSINELTSRARRTFNDQKQFIENASHELQTPLAINQSKLEQLIEDPNLTEQQAEIIQTLINSTQRMSRLNRTLLLLSKMENDQFIETERVYIAPLVEEILSAFEDLRNTNQITVEIDFKEKPYIVGNKTLIDLLVSNLIKNAFVPNYRKGRISMDFTKKSFTISNTSEGSEIPADKLFQRFYKNTNRKESWGLGLAIVNKICLLNNWKINYLKKGDVHSFTIMFN